MKVKWRNSLEEYPFITYSDSDPLGRKGGMGFETREEAEKHVALMNSHIHTYNNEDSMWNKTYWKEEPKEWRVHEVIRSSPSNSSSNV